MDHIRSGLPKVLHKRGLHGQVSASLVTYKAQQWLQQTLPDIAQWLSVQTLMRGTLSIAASHSIAAQECQQVLPLLKRYLAQECPAQLVEEIRLIRGK